MDYLRVLKRTAGYFVFDPQKDRILDPETEDLGEHGSYEKIVRDMPGMVAELVKERGELTRKPWWKFW